MKHLVLLIGYNAKGRVVYTDRLTTYQYYDGEHVWDETESILKLNLVRLIGEIYDGDGNVSQSFETRFSAETGLHIGGKTVWSDGTVTNDGLAAG